MYTYTGTSAPITLKRVAGVVLGKVVGVIVQLSFAVKQWYSALAFATSMWIVVAFTFFLYLHSSPDVGYVSCLTAAYASAAMIPADGHFREPGYLSINTIVPSVFNAIVGTVLGVGILTMVDLLFASRATNQAQQRLKRAILRTERCVISIISDVVVADEVERMLLEDLDDADGARQLLATALEDKRRRFGPDHPDVAKIRAQLDILCTLPQLPPTMGYPPPKPRSVPKAALAQDVALSSTRHVLGVSGKTGDESLSGMWSRRKMEKVRGVFEDWATDSSVASDSALGGTKAAGMAISKEALSAKLRCLRPSMTDEDVDHIFETADANKDGRIDYTEFVEWFSECRSLHEDLLCQRPSQS